VIRILEHLVIWGLFSLNTQYIFTKQQQYPSHLGIMILKWERTFEKNIGLEVGTKSFNMTLDLYHNLTKDLIVLVALPLSVGFESRWENRGEVTNMGVEWSFDVDMVRSKNLYWNFNFSGLTIRMFIW